MNNAFLRRVNRPRKPIIIWDFDGTAIDESQYRACTQIVFKNAFEIQTTDEEYELFFADQSYNAEHTIAFLISKGVQAFNIPPIKTIFDLIDDEFKKLIVSGRVEAVEKSVRLMHAFHSLGHTQCLVTGTNREIVNEALTSLIPNYFRHIVTREDTFWQKPHPQPYALVFELLNALPNECVIIENTRDGILAGNLAGARTISVDSICDDKVINLSPEPPQITRNFTFNHGRLGSLKLELPS